MTERSVSVTRMMVTVFLILFSAGPSWAFGPHGGGTIGEAIGGTPVPAGFPIYEDYEAPYAYPSMTRRDLMESNPGAEVIEVEGSSKMKGFFIPIFLSVGGLSIHLDDRSVRAALEDARKRYGVRNLYDIRIDLHFFSILGIYNTRTTIIHAKGIRDKNHPPGPSDPQDPSPSETTPDAPSAD